VRVRELTPDRCTVAGWAVAGRASWRGCPPREGRPPQSDDAVVSLGDLEAARARTLEPDLPLVVACDVARFGNDLTTIAVRRGNVVRIVRSYGGRGTMQTVGEIMSVPRDLHCEQQTKPVLIVDDAGVGGGVTDRLRELDQFEVIAYNSAKSAQRSSDYPNRRSEDWFDLAARLREIDLDPADEQLAADLLSPRYCVCQFRHCPSQSFRGSYFGERVRLVRSAIEYSRTS
jgi:hypothetical protein